MEHLDLAGYLNTPVTWNLGAFEQQDGIYLSSSRQMLEPIMEETSEDEEHAQNSWNGHDQRGSCGGFWSSAESETGSVIRVEITKDIDAISERDFACPPKRARRSQEEEQLQRQQLQQQPHSLEDVVQMRRPPPPRYDSDAHNSLERFLALEACARDSYGSVGQRSSTGSRRGGGVFDEFYSDNDSYHSLSRSSSLVQFESLERQLTLQEQHQSMNSLGNSSPSLLSCETVAGSSSSNVSSGTHSNPDSRRGSATSLLKRYESSDGRLHQTYYELHKLDFEEQQRELFGACKSLVHQAEIKSDSESSSSSSTSSSDSSGHSLLSACPGKQDASNARRLPLNSAENLSEDSGYCEPSTLRRSKSKSIPKNFDKLCEEEEEFEELEAIVLNSNDLCQTKIVLQQQQEKQHQTNVEETQSTSSAASPTSSINSCEESNNSATSPSPSPSLSASPSPSASTSASSVASFTWLRNSLPDIREPRGSSPNFLTDNNNSYVLATNSSKNNHDDVDGTSTNCSNCSSSSNSSSPVLTRAESGGGGGSSSSVPNELQQLGRRRRTTTQQLRRQQQQQQRHQNISSEGHSSSEDLDQFDCNSLPRMRRSCSWNDRVGAAGAGAGAGGGSSYLNASYQNLTLLDYTDPSENCKRSMDKRKQRMSAGEDCEFICRGNFLLDELSHIYDKNASILNDKTDAEEQEPRPVPKPLKELLQQAEEEEKEAPPQVQHVQLTIRKPPARQKRLNLEKERNSSVSTPQPPPAAVISFSSFGKTFDQDPTNLRTSYAQSLEQCNFEVPPTSQSTHAKPNTRALPKRRFQSSTAKQRSLVSSTPNLSAFDNGNQETEDDIYVSSAHNSMHQLPQTPTQPKPLGILLPAGSRNSFSKEVSFCPVVSKYCWQEQSSEEPQEEQVSSDDDEEQAEEGEEGLVDDDGDDDDDEEQLLLDNNDATVIYNTKENENIAVRYNEEQRLRAKQQEQQTKAQESVQTCTIVAKSTESNNENIASASVETKQPKTSQTSSSPQPVSVSSVAAAVSLEPRVDASSSSTCAIVTPVTVTPTTTVSSPQHTRPLSLHLPILSEPPTNRAHHILYASQQLLQRYDHNNEDDKRINIANMPKSQAITPASSNNNESPIKQQQRANKSDEKHPSSKSFLSRFAHGLRFSLRRKKKQQHQQQTTTTPQTQIQQQPQSQSQPNKQKQSNGNAQDFIYIPLKPPRSSSSSNAVLDDSNASEASTVSVNSRQITAVGTAVEPAKTSTLQKLVTGKPPLPKLPPRQTHAPCVVVAASAAHHNSNPASAAYVSSNALFLDAERQQYAAFAAQLTAGQLREMSLTDTGTGNGTDMARDTESPSRATVAQKTQMFNQLGTASALASGSAGYNKPRPLTMVTAVPVAVSPIHDNGGKMGLIETNLDTHETVISGKTRSLMDITSNPMQQQHKRYLVKRLNVTSANYQDVGHDDNDDDDDEVDNRIKISSQGGGVQIASVRRPHKSMEFLLDKENQKNVLPPENELQKSHDHNPAALSEHQLRVQASLQRLNIPDWFRQYNQNAARSPDGAVAGNAGATASSGGYKPGNFTRKRTQDSGRWQGLNSKTTSLSSLGSQRSDRSPLLLSPSAHSHHGGQSSGVSGSASAGAQHGQGQGQGVGATRWSTSHLNSTQTSPSVSQRGSFARGVPTNGSFISVASGSSAGAGGVLRNSYRQPYLGWRSTEKLSQRTPHERLANSLLAQRTSPTTSTPANGVRTLQPVTPEIQSSIKEVTSAIVHYVNDQTQAQQYLQQQHQQQRSRSASPNSRKCWLESSFVGTRPLDSPQTPVIDSSSSPPSSQQQYQQYPQLHLDATTVVAIRKPPLRMNGPELSRVGGGGAPERSLSNASLEDVLASLLGLPTTSSSNSQYTNSQNTNNNNRNQATASTIAGSSTTGMNLSRYSSS